MKKKQLDLGSNARVETISIELGGKLWVANEQNAKADAIPAEMTHEQRKELMEDRIIEMAWEDRTPFEAIKIQFAYSEGDVIALMRLRLKRSSFNLWRKRVNTGVSQKHLKLRDDAIQRFRCSRQNSIANNKISKR